MLNKQLAFDLCVVVAIKQIALQACEALVKAAPVEPRIEDHDELRHALNLARQALAMNSDSMLKDGK